MLSYLIIVENFQIPIEIVNDNSAPLIAKDGSNFTYECRVNQPVSQSHAMCFGWARYRGTEKGRLVTADFRFSSTLALVNVTEEDEDLWVCMASDQKSQNYKVFNLDVIG